LFVVSFMFYQAAKRDGRSKFLWMTFGFIFWFLLGGLFLVLTDKLILHINSMEAATSLGGEKLVFEGISAMIIILLAYLVQEKIGEKKKEQFINRYQKLE
ncbi:MAG: hypothetical protein WB996_03600, partial [Ignavibacteriaceae bacterium]